MSERELFDYFERGLKYDEQKTLALMDINTLEAYTDRAEIDLHGRDRNHVAPKVNQALALGDFLKELKKQNKVETDKLGKEIKDLKEILEILGLVVTLIICADAVSGADITPLIALQILTFTVSLYSLNNKACKVLGLQSHFSLCLGICNLCNRVLQVIRRLP